ncbi:hypothetical protein DVH24_036255 [Malus domestica]|uniref:Uncharacterized protein n=1 Tax=Malus domestica TaxID=3750 RepID=A0A498IIC3_MALDO|nr:hypothetical protein DVH24_036255 [Malus domestica]
MGNQWLSDSMVVYMESNAFSFIDNEAIMQPRRDVLLLVHFHHCSTILSVLGLPFPHGFVFGNSRATSQWVIHPESALTSFSLNFEVPTEPEASELPKGLVLGRDVNMRLRITPLNDVGCYN